MRFSHFFIARPIFAAVVSIFIILIGIFAYPQLPVGQYPEIAPPTITVSAQYPGASAETLADSVAQPLEDSINGVEHMLYMTTSATNDGRLRINVVFDIGTDLDTAQIKVENRVQTAEPRLPDEVRQIGVTTQQQAPDLLMVGFLQSPDNSRSHQYLSNYARLHVIDRLKRIQGIGDILVLGSRDYSMRIWIDPDLAAARNLTADEVVNALRASNVQVATGAVGAPPFASNAPAFQLNVQTKGRLTTPEDFGDIIVKSDADGRVTRINDIGRVELGAEQYITHAYVGPEEGVGLGISQRPGSNALATADEISRTMQEMQKDFPSGVSFSIPYNPTDYVRHSLSEVQRTLFEALILVSLVVLVFLQSWRAAIIPIIAIPVSLIGTFAVMLALGFSLNNLSMFGLVLAIGIVVDDAIVVVENVERELDEGLDPRDAARVTMDEVGSAVIAIALVLSAVFIPTAFISGISGQFYKQFAITIAAATLISLLVSLTLSPALAAILLRQRDTSATPPASRVRRLTRRFSERFNRGFRALSEHYGHLTDKLVHNVGPMLIVYAVLIGITLWRFDATPTGFIPEQDQGYLLAVVQLPQGSSVARTNAVAQQISAEALKVRGVSKKSIAVVGFNVAQGSLSANFATIFVQMVDEKEKHRLGVTTQDVNFALQKMAAGIEKANVLVITPPPVRGIGTGGGFKMMVEDRAGLGYRALEQATQELAMAANQQPGLSQVFTLFNTSTPRLFADIDRTRAEMLGVPIANVFDTLQVYLGSSYVNDFNMLGRTFRVTAQASAPARGDVADVSRLRVRSRTGDMVPISAFTTVRSETGPDRVVRHNLSTAAELQGTTLPGTSSGQAIRMMEQLATEHLPAGMSFEWTELAFQQVRAGNTAGIVFGMAIMFVFLVLAAQYESLTLPLAIILIVPMCLLAAIVGVNIRGMDNNILTQIGLVVLVGLAAKNAVLIVEFAAQAEERGLDRFAAAVEAARLRLRPILMTSIAFILGVTPLVTASGPGAEMRQALGTAVFAGMLGVTLFGLVFTPVFYIACRDLADRLRFGKQKKSIYPAE